jgi:hypothetical protein
MTNGKTRLGANDKFQNTYAGTDATGKFPRSLEASESCATSDTMSPGSGALLKKKGSIAPCIDTPSYITNFCWRRDMCCMLLFAYGQKETKKTKICLERHNIPRSVFLQREI